MEWTRRGQNRMDCHSHNASGLPDEVHEANLFAQDLERSLDWFAADKVVWKADPVFSYLLYKTN